MYGSSPSCGCTPRESTYNRETDGDCLVPVDITSGRNHLHSVDGAGPEGGEAAS
jgi:hypothetical protein